MSNSDFEIVDGVLKKYNGKNDEVIIPEGVTTIGEGAFSALVSLKSVTIPESVTTICRSAFIGHTLLTNIMVNPNSKTYKSIDGNLYSYDGTKLVQYAIGKTDETFEFPEGVTTIGEEAFYRSEHLKNITIPGSVTAIGDSAFGSCGALTNINISNGVTTIDRFAFICCHSLSYIEIPESVTFIGQAAFGSCTSLIKVIIRGNTATVSKWVFKLCNKLKFINCGAKKPLFSSQPKGWDEDWLGDGEYKCPAKVIWNYKGK